MKKLLVATHNRHKTGEIAAILKNHFEVTDLTSYPDFPPTDETGSTFEENAVLKATEASRAFKGLVLADDSGLEVDALNGAPGVRSARYSGENATDATNRERLLEELAKLDSRGKERIARFRCVMALADNGTLLKIFHGTVEGIIINQPRGDGGFGYDPLFVPNGYCETFAQLSAEIKNRESHRAHALQQVLDYLNDPISS